MFIPIDAKADIADSKKGKLTPAQHAQITAWSLASKTGILDIYNNTTKGYERCEATNTTYTATNNVATVVFKKGYIAICGRIVECEDGTDVQIITPATGSVTGKIILRYSLANAKEQEFEVTTKVGPLRQEDLNDNPQVGVYEFELYEYTATPNQVTLKRNDTNYIPDIGGKLDQFEKSLTAEGKPLGGYDTSKGTIEERLTALGFRIGSVSVLSGTATVKYVARQGNYCILNLSLENIDKEINANSSLNLAVVPYLPNADFKCFAKIVYDRYTYESSYLERNIEGFCEITIKQESGYVTPSVIPMTGAKYYLQKVIISNFGYIATPIQ